MATTKNNFDPDLKLGNEKLNDENLNVAIEMGNLDCQGETDTNKSPNINHVAGLDISVHSVSYLVDIKDKQNSKLFRPKTKEKQLLENITVSFPAGKMTALMGSSGAGKSTLLDVIADRKNSGTLVGEVLFNGKERPKNFKSINGYVEQQDIVSETLTVYENLYYISELKLPQGKYTRAEKDQRIEQIISDMGITRCQDTVVGNCMKRGISGGELKRLSIGLEVVTLPPILFLDEPTSGLDSATTMDVVNVLQKLATNGHTIICTIHQPSAEAFSMFDRLVLLSKGQVAFSGLAHEGAPYLKSLGFAPIGAEKFGFNPAEFLLSVTGGGTGKGIKTITGPTIESFGKVWEQSRSCTARKESVMKSMEIKDSSGSEGLTMNSFWHQLKILTQRDFRSVTRDAEYFSMRVLKNVSVGVVFLTIYHHVYENNFPNVDMLGLVFMVISMWGFNGVDYVTTMLNDRELFYRERNGGACTVLPHYLSKILLGLPYSLTATLCFSVPIYFGCGFYKILPPDYNYAGDFFIFWLVVFLLDQVAGAFAACVSASSPNINVAVGIAPALLVLQMLFSGFLITTSNIPPYWRYTFRYFNFFTFSFTSLAINSFQGTDQDQLLDRYELREMGLWGNIGVLAGLLLVWHILGYLALRFIKHQTR